MYERGVLGGSMFGLTFFHASTKLESAAGAAGRSDENRRDAAPRRGRRRRDVARRNMVREGVVSLGLARSERESECLCVNSERAR